MENRCRQLNGIRGLKDIRSINVAGDAEIGHVGDVYGYSADQVAVIIAEMRQESQPKVGNGRNSYRALNVFREEHAAYFFGRDGVINDLLTGVKQPRFMVIAGLSGSGISSVARDGLFHGLREGKLPGSESWRLVTMLPKDDPFKQMAEAFNRLEKSPDAG